MKRFLTLVATLTLAVTAFAGDEAPKTLTTLKGQRYENVRILKAYPHGLAFAHSKGAAQILFTELPQTWRTRYNYDAAAAKKYVDTHVEAQRAREVAAKRQQVDAARSRAFARSGGISHGVRGPWAAAGYPLPVDGFYDGGYLPPLGASYAWDGTKRRSHTSRNWPPANYIANRYTDTSSFLMFGGYAYPTPGTYNQRAAHYPLRQVPTRTFLQGPRYGAPGSNIGGTGLINQSRSSSILHR